MGSLLKVELRLAVKEGGGLSKTNKSRRNRLLRLCTVYGKQSPAAAKDLDELIARVGEP